MKHQKHVVVKHFSGVKIADANHYKNPTQEKPPAEIIIHVGTNDLSCDNEPKDINTILYNMLNQYAKRLTQTK